MRGPLPYAIRVAVTDFERAICRDRCHAIMVAPDGPEGTELFDALESRLNDSLRAVRVPRDVSADRIAAVVVERLEPGGGFDADARLLGCARDLGKRGSALVLVVEDAAALPPRTLRHLGRLAARSDRSLRLALFVGSDGRSGEASIAEVVAGLGVGAQKIRLHGAGDPSPTPPRVQVDAVRWEAAAVAVPRAPLTPRRQPVRIPRPETRGGSPRRWAARAGLAAGLVLALLGAQRLLVAEAPVEVALGHVSAPGENVRARIASSAPAAAPVVRAPAAIAAKAARPAPPEAKRPPAPPTVAKLAGEVLPEEKAPEKKLPEAVDPAIGEKPAPPPKPRPVAAKPTPRPVRVSLNARPWGRVEVDGREVGITPLANVPLSPGSHRFRVHLPDGRVIDRTLRVDRHRNHISFP